MLARQIFSRLGLLLSLSILAVPATAQDIGSAEAEPAPAPASKAQEIEVLLARINETDGQLVQLIDEIDTAEGEERVLLRNQIDGLSRQQRSDLRLLLDLITAREAAGGDVAMFEPRAEQFLRDSSRRLRAYIQALEKALVTAAASRATIEPADLPVFENRIADDTSRLDQYYQGLIDLKREMARAGLNTNDETAFLEDRLGGRGDRLLRLLEITKKELDQYKELLKQSPGDGDLQARVFAMEERYHSNKTSLLTTIHMMRALGRESTDLEVQALQITGEVTPDALQVKVATGLMADWWRRTKTYWITSGPKLAVRLLVIVAILVAFWILARLTKWFTRKALQKTTLSTSELLKNMTITMVGRVVMLIGVTVVLGRLGINIGPLLAGLGIAGFILGFALQDTLSNFAAGAMILFYRPYDVGDFVEAAGITGKVKDMNLVSTRILTVDHQTLIVPNSKIWGDVIRNVTAQPRRRIDMVFGISYEDEIAKAEQVLQEIVDAHEKVLVDPEPIIKVHTLNDSSVDFIVRPWAKTDDYWDVYWDITREVKLRFDKEGISIPYPQRDVHFKGQGSHNTPTTGHE